MRHLICAVLFAVVATVAAAVEPDEILDDPALEARARGLSAELRCVVCQNESIDSSNAGVARDLRLLVRERLVAGDTDQEVLDYIVARYGDFVLFRPPWKPTTYALWLAPAVIFLGGAIGVTVALRGRRQRTGDALSEEETVELDAFLSRQGDGQ
ncbi:MULTISPECIES: cytochrome c-type biogenesis protein [Roseobacteraceae]|uniref:Cytochrome c-type biogenesis protein n=3 Tax=Roseobacteraceae TaxID=2854170 RepID=A0A2R8BQU6_9RHOB|nr:MULTISPECIES: cytochrome c-type biogenesis protein [Roseobacteraceae]MDT0684078.1 cytochrome c-type biogenesis protein [Roseicyclus sp. F158]SEO10184.1 cytochrome c-type biogenesis protein CcmH [Palleronia pelagia]SPJ22542.1 Cytochrome c-type biogenesis protein CcmH [Palleronia abyssalis]